jgi:hypothetical protein
MGCHYVGFEIKGKTEILHGPNDLAHLFQQYHGGNL